MKHIPRILSVMTPFPYSVELDTPLIEVRQLMTAHDIRHLPVTDKHELAGIVSDRDITLVVDSERTGGDVSKQTVREAFVDDPYIVDLNEPVDNVLFIMAERHIGATLVTRKGQLAGLFTVTDACRAFGEFLREHFLPAGGDDAA